MNMTPVFVYGTLRVGQGNYGWCAGGVFVGRTIQDAVTQGDLYFVAGPNSFPVADAYGEGCITGDVLYFDPESEHYEQMCEMEMGAGYVPVVVEVAHPDYPGVIKALMWHYNRPLLGRIQIPHGDWVRALRRG